MQLLSPTGVKIGTPTAVTVDVHADWEGIGALIVGILLVLLFGFGIVRNILRRRRENAAADAGSAHRRATDADGGDGATGPVGDADAAAARQPAPTTRRSRVSSIGRSSAMLASGTLVSRILGFVKAWLLLQAIGGLSFAANAYATSTIVPNSIYAIIAQGILNAVLVPQIVRASVHADGGKAYINKLVTLGILIFAAVALVATLLSPLLDAAVRPPRFARRTRDRVRVLVAAADLLPRALHAARRGAQRAQVVRPVHLGAGGEQRGRDRRC